MHLRHSGALDAPGEVAAGHGRWWEFALLPSQRHAPDAGGHRVGPIGTSVRHMQLAVGVGVVPSSKPQDE